MRFLTLLLTTVLVGLTAAHTDAAPAPAAGARGIVLPFPAKSQIVLQIQGIQRSRERIEALITAAAPNEAGAVKDQIKQILEKFEEERKLTAVPGDGRWYIVIRDVSTFMGEEPDLAVLIPVKDAKSFRETFLTADEQKSLKKGEAGISTFNSAAIRGGTDIHLVEQPGYAMLTPSRETAELYAGKYDRATTDTLGVDASKALLESDLSLYVNMESINDKFGQQLQQGKALLDILMQQAAGAGNAGISKRQLDAAKVMFKGLFQGLEDSKSFVVGVELRPVGLALRLLGHFDDGTPTGKLLRNEELSPLADLGKLPQGQMAYFSGKLGSEVAKQLRAFTQQIAGPEDDDKTEKAIEDYLEAIQAARPEADYQSVSPPDASLAVKRYRDAGKAMTAELKLYNSLPVGSSVQNVMLKEKPAVTEKAHTVGSFSFNEVKLTFDFEATVKDLPEQMKEATIASMKQMLGGDQLRIFFGTDGKDVIQVVAKDWTAAKTLVEVYLAGKSTLGQEAAYKLTRENLPAGTSLVGVMDTGRLIGFMGSYMRQMADLMPGFPAQIPELKPAKGDPAFAGVALSLKPEIIQVDLFVPAASVEVARKILAPLMQKVD